MMEDKRSEGDEKESLLSVLFSSPPPFRSSPDFCSEILSEIKALSMANNDCSSALSSPTEASPAKPDRKTSLFDRSAPSPPTSHGASASENVVAKSRHIVKISESSPLLPVPSYPFGTPNQERELPSTLAVNGVSVTLENESVWKQFYSCGTEMVLTKGGRRMFPYCRYRLRGLDPDKLYSLILSIVPFGQDRYHWIGNKWKVLSELQDCKGPFQAFSHHYEPFLGSVWMGCSVSFYKLKLTNHFQDLDEHIVLNSLHRYIPRLHVVPVSDENVPSPDNSVTLGPETMTFIFPQTEFVTVTTYQNFQITQLKINHNPFAKGFREDGKNPRLQRFNKVEQKSDALVLNPVDTDEKEAALDLSIKKTPVAEETKLVLKPIMSTSASKDDLYTTCMHGKPSLAELVFVEKPEQKETNLSVSINPEVQNDSNAPTWSGTPSVSKTPVTSTPATSGKFLKKRKRVNKRWGNPKGREWYRREAFAKALGYPLMSNTFTAELDEVEGVLFVSFSSKEALESHMKEQPSTNPSPSAILSPSTPTESTHTEEAFSGVLEEEDEIVDIEQEIAENETEIAENEQEVVENEQEKIIRLESILLNDLRTFKHKQAIHPVLQEVGLKLSLLDSTREIDLQYLGVSLPLTPTDIQDQTTLSSADDGSSFISRTGKTSDVTKIKGWKNKFSTSNEISPTKNEGLPKNLSAFCSDLLDEYLESEAKQITERADAFSTHLEDSVSYQLPVKSSSYVKTLDSALKHRNTASNMPLGVKRPYKLSSKASVSSAMMSSPPPTMSPAEASFRMFPSHVEEQPAVNVTQSLGVAPRGHGLVRVLNKMLKMESGALNRGLLGTKLTQERLTVALSVMLTKEMHYGPALIVPQFPTKEVLVPECGKDFCRLGCLCSSLQSTSRRRLHCGRTQCMLGCTCFKRKLKKRLTAGECEQEMLPAYSLTYTENLGPPRPGYHSNKLWKNNMRDVDSEPHFSLSSSSFFSMKDQNPKTQVQPSVPEVPDEDKDPVYKYFENMMTCARVREFKHKAPSEVTLETKPVSPPTPKTSVNPVKRVDRVEPQRKDDYNNKAVVQQSEKTSQGAGVNNNKTRTKIQILSTCSWEEDRMMILKALCERMSQNRLDKDFNIGTYCISPINKLLTQKPNGKLITYRIRISKRSKDSESEVDEYDDNEGDFDEGLVDEQERTVGVTPFMRGVIAAGRLKALKKTPGADTKGLVQVNNKVYSQARLLLGNIGSLHPANRLAAYVTGRLPTPTIKIPEKPKSNLVATLPKKREEPVVQPAPTSSSTDVNPTLKLPASDLGNIGLNTSSQPPPQISPKLYPLNSTVSNHHGFSTILQSPLSLTVSPSLKSPSFLGEKGTCSFRIFPPSIQSSSQQKQPGVSLPGGYTLIQLSGPESEGNPVRSKTTDKTIMADSAPEPGECTFFQAPMKQPHFDTLSEDGLEIVDDEVSAGVSDASKKKLTAPRDDPVIIDSSSDSSDESGEDELVDIETIEGNQEISASEQIREDESEGFDLRRSTHTVVERLRRCEQRILFEKLQTILRKDNKTPQLVLLSRAREEIESLVVNSKILESRKRMLMEVQSAHVKKLSLLSGKSESQIRNKLLEISMRHKVKIPSDPVSRSFARFGLSRAAFKKVTSPPSAPTPQPQVLPPAEHSPSQNLSPVKHLECPDTPKDKSDEIERQTTKDKDGDSLETITPSQLPSKFLSFPLIRSKDGRIILPSCMQQLGKNLVTFRVMKLKKNGEGDNSAHNEDSPENLQINTSASNQSAPTNNQSTLVPSIEMFKRTDGEQSHPIVYLGSSMPPKDGPNPGGKRYFMTPETRELLNKKITSLVKDNAEKDNAEKDKAADVDADNVDESTENQSQVKRPRGRPRKRKSQDTDHFGATKKQLKALAKREKQDRTVSFTKIPGEPSKTRPLTRGSLGKDFPSAKKQSWIDVERELMGDESN